MNYFYLFLAFMIGITNVVQGGVNAQLRQHLQEPIVASMVSFVVGLSALIVCLVFFKNPQNNVSIQSFGQLSWWQWTGGLMGAFYVFTVVLVAKDIGSVNLICFTVAGQMLATAFIDQYGWLGFAQHSANIWRILGMLLIVAGVYLVLKN